MQLVLAADPLSHVVDHAIWAPGGWYVLTNHMIMMVVAAGLMLLIFPRITRPYQDGKLVPTGTRNFFEAIMVYVRNDVAKPVLGGETDKSMPFPWTVFFFILFNNLLGLLPLDSIVNAIQGFDEAGKPRYFYPVYGTPTANLGVTAVLAIIAFVAWNYRGIKANGIKPWAHHFLGGAPVYMAPIMVPVEILGMFVKPFALAIRLMANMTAGHVLIAVLTGTLSLMAFNLGTVAGLAISVPIVLGAVAIMLLELFVAFLQAYIFTFLTTLFIGQLVIHEHDHHEGEGGVHIEHDESIGGGDLTDFAKLPEGARHAGTHAAG